jgi:hypothetical protein
VQAAVSIAISGRYYRDAPLGWAIALIGAIVCINNGEIEPIIIAAAKLSLFIKLVKYLRDI